MIFFEKSGPEVHLNLNLKVETEASHPNLTCINHSQPLIPESISFLMRYARREKPGLSLYAEG